MTPEWWPKFEGRWDVDPNGCWVWNGYITNMGYGMFRMGTWGKPTYFSGLAHRLSYSVLVGPIPEGLVLDHVCRNTRCCNPDHLEPVTQRENMLRGVHPKAVAHHSNVCVSGRHELTPDNVKVAKNGRRTCRACANERYNETVGARSRALTQAYRDGLLPRPERRYKPRPGRWKSKTAA